MDIKLIIFDMGETLLNFGRVNVNQAFKEGAEATYQFLRDISGNRVCLPPFWRYHWGNWLSVRFQYLMSIITLKEFSFMDLMAGRVKTMGIDLNDQQKAELTRLWFQNAEQFAQIEDNLLETLEELKAMAIQLAIISNTFLPAFIHERQLEEFGLIDHFCLRLYSSETLWRKPHNRIYQMALEHLGVEPGQAVMVGDRLKEDVRGPEQLGIRGVFKRGEVNREKKVPGNIPVIDRIAELPDLVRQWNNQSR